MRSEEIRQDMLHEARMTAEYAARGLWDLAAGRAKSYERLQNQLRALGEPPYEDAPPD